MQEQGSSCEPQAMVCGSELFPLCCFLCLCGWTLLLPRPPAALPPCPPERAEQVSFAWSGFNNAMISNVGMVLRNIYSKKFLGQMKVCAAAGAGAGGGGIVVRGGSCCWTFPYTHSLLLCPHPHPPPHTHAPPPPPPYAPTPPARPPPALHSWTASTCLPSCPSCPSPTACPAPWCWKVGGWVGEWGGRAGGRAGERPVARGDAFLGPSPCLPISPQAPPPPTAPPAPPQASRVASTTGPRCGTPRWQPRAPAASRPGASCWRRAGCATTCTTRPPTWCWARASAQSPSLVRWVRWVRPGKAGRGRAGKGAAGGLRPALGKRGDGRLA